MSCHLQLSCSKFQKNTSRFTAEQIGDVAKKLCYKLNVNVKTVLGGKTKKLMMNPEFESVDILVGSMGVVSKLVTTGVYRMQCVRHVVIDEADTMFDDSFADKLVYFMRRFPVDLFRNFVVGNLSFKSTKKKTFSSTETNRRIRTLLVLNWFSLRQRCQRIRMNCCNRSSIRLPSMKWPVQICIESCRM